MTSREAFEMWIDSDPNKVGTNWVSDRYLAWQAAVEACKPWMGHKKGCPGSFYRWNKDTQKHDIPCAGCTCGLDEFLRSET